MQGHKRGQNIWGSESEGKKEGKTINYKNSPHLLHEATDAQIVDLILKFFLHIRKAVEIGEVVHEFAHVEPLCLLSKLVLVQLHPLHYLQQSFEFLVLIEVILACLATWIRWIVIVEIAEDDIVSNVAQGRGVSF